MIERAPSTPKSVPLRRRLFYAYTELRYWLGARLLSLGLRRWCSPHVIKRGLVAGVAERGSFDVFIETGTYRGDMIQGLRGRFAELHSIELSDALFERAEARFRGDPRIKIHHGDSGRVLAQVLEACREPALFWLDAHYSGGATARGAIDSPIAQELQHILTHPVSGHAVLIDDARLFLGENGYPTLEELSAFVRVRRPDYSVAVVDDVIFLVPDRRVLPEAVAAAAARGG